MVINPMDAFVLKTEILCSMVSIYKPQSMLKLDKKMSDLIEVFYGFHEPYIMLV